MKLLLLAGTHDARVIAIRLANETSIEVVASLPDTTRAPVSLAVPTRVGGFGGDEGFRKYLIENNIAAVLDASHPFADRVTNRSLRICIEEDRHYCQVLRPAWAPQAGDLWTMIDREENAVDYVRAGDRVFLATGRQTLMQFSNLQHCELVCRQIDATKDVFPFPNGRYLVGHPPFTVEDETALFRDLKIDWLVVKNAGGEAPRSKLLAARKLGIPVLMVNRPAMPHCKRVSTVDDAIDWVKQL